MAFGPGKYDDLATLVRERVGITDQTGGGVILIVVGGTRGHGMSCQADLATTLMLPEVLEQVARDMRANGLEEVTRA